MTTDLAPAPSPAPMLSVPARKKILVIEDDPDMCLGYGIFLEANQYDTCFATDGLSAIRQARTHEPDLILLDLSLPAGDGFVVMERLRKITELAAIPVIVVTARVPFQNEERSIEAGAKAFVQKPWNNQDLLAMIARYLSDPGGASPSPSPSSAVLDISVGSFGVALRKAA